MLRPSVRSRYSPYETALTRSARIERYVAVEDGTLRETQFDYIRQSSRIMLDRRRDAV